MLIAALTLDAAAGPPAPPTPIDPFSGRPAPARTHPTESLDDATGAPPIAASGTVTDDGAPAHAPLPTMISGWVHTPGVPVVPVFDAAVVRVDGWTVLLGGMTGAFDATPVIQLHHPLDGWQPIAARLREARSRATMTSLPDGRVLLTGGLTGRLGEDARPLDSCELVDPLVAGTARAIEPLDEALVGHTAHLLPDGAVAVAGGGGVRRLDPAEWRWSATTPFEFPRAEHASVALSNGHVIVIGGSLDPMGAGTIEEIDPLGRRAPVLWPKTLNQAVSRCSAIRLPDGRILVAGGYDEIEERTLSDTWILDPATRAVHHGPRLPLGRGLADAALFETPRGIVIAGGEWRDGDSRGEAGAAFLFQPGDGAIARDDRLWALVPMPTGGCRGQWHQLPGGLLAVQGGYEFVDEETALREGIEAGPRVTGETLSLWIGDLGEITD